MNGDDIIAGLKLGDGDALKKIYIAYRVEFLKWTIRKFNLSIDEAKDIYQYAVVELYENVTSGRLEKLNSSIKTYLFAIGKYKALDYCKRKATTTEFLDYSISDTQVEAEENNSDPEVLEDQLSALEKGILKVGEPCKSLMEHFYYYKRKSDEIAEILGYKNADTVKNLRHKCLKRLRKIFYKSSQLTIKK